LNEVDMFCLHFSYHARVEQCIQHFQEAWNNHQLTTENIATSIQMYIAGMISTDNVPCIKFCATALTNSWQSHSSPTLSLYALLSYQSSTAIFRIWSLIISKLFWWSTLCVSPFISRSTYNEWLFFLCMSCRWLPHASTLKHYVTTSFCQNCNVETGKVNTA